MHNLLVKWLRKLFFFFFSLSNCVLWKFYGLIVIFPVCDLRLKVVTLTHGARALAKHANRSSSKYWGTLEGSGEDLFEFGGLFSFSHCGLLDAQVCKKNFCMLSNVYNHSALRDRDFLTVVLHWPISHASVEQKLSFSACLPNTNFLWDLLKQILQIIYN